MSHGHVRPAGASHEEDRASVRGILLFSLLTLMLVAISGVIGAGQMIVQQHLRPDRLPFNESPDMASVPYTVQGWAEPGKELIDVRQREADHLTGYRWIDQRSGVVRIPIERAMQILATPTTKPAEVTR